MNRNNYENNNDEKYEDEYMARLEYNINQYEEKTKNKKECNMDELIEILEQIVEDYTNLDINACDIDRKDFERKKAELSYLKERRTLQTDALAEEAKRLSKEDFEDNR